MRVNRKTINGSCKTADEASQILVLKIKFMLDVDKIPSKVRLTSVFCELVSKKKKYIIYNFANLVVAFLSLPFDLYKDMCIHVYVCMYLCVHMRMCICIWIFKYMSCLCCYICTFRYICLSIYVHTILRMCVSVHKYSFIPYTFSVCLG